jgi:hypothetical protein
VAPPPFGPLFRDRGSGDGIGVIGTPDVFALVCRFRSSAGAALPPEERRAAPPLLTLLLTDGIGIVMGVLVFVVVIGRLRSVVVVGGGRETLLLKLLITF